MYVRSEAVDFSLLHIQHNASIVGLSLAQLFTGHKERCTVSLDGVESYAVGIIYHAVPARPLEPDSHMSLSFHVSTKALGFAALI